ncbi:hypothetical protein [Bizionia paragorgiae]|uniref:Uncharacterized protein n=1 Tax=Bizionia paragorgiae TaxID=283786 RepID=A0A1H4AUF0_BIZPA|nr:hypothetical protein [Bizionia paragorgiae]SEA39262.1 hypothetical protein SAMN04487990_11210 [Bizionia paragorgiae]
MHPKTITVYPSDIRATKAFKKLNQIQQKLVLNSTNIKHIEYGLNLTANRGLDFWTNKVDTYFLNVRIVTELNQNRTK